MKKVFLILRRSAPLFIFVICVIVIFICSNASVYLYGFYQGYNQASVETGKDMAILKVNLENLFTSELSKMANKPTPTPKTVVIEKTVIPATPAPVTYSEVNWGGPELWDAVNTERQRFGVNPLSSKSEFCTIASIRLNELLQLGQLDGHEGFSNLAERRPDLAYIFEKYNISEFLVQGATSAQEAVSLWENTLGHRKLLDGGEYVWGCIYAQNSFGVAIAAY
jgi:uncharacterized protein YkwD